MRVHLPRELTILILGLSLPLACGEDGKVDPADALKILTTALDPASLSSSYSARIEAEGGVPPYTFALASGALPEGLMLKTETGQIEGMATTPGTFEFSISVTDAEAAQVSQALSIRVEPNALVVTTADLPQAREGAEYEALLAGEGGIEPYTWSITGALPDGITLNQGALGGTPTEFGLFEFTVELADSEGSTAQKALSIFVVSRAPMIITETVPDGDLGEAYSAMLEVQGGTPPYEWQLTNGQLPLGLALDQNGVISGTIQESGDFTFFIRATDTERRWGQNEFTIRVAAPLAIDTVSIPEVISRRLYSFTFQASGGKPPYEWTLEGGMLPAGLSLGTSGLLSGSTVEAGTFSVTVKVSDSEGAERSALFNVNVSDRVVFQAEPMVTFPPTCTATTVSYRTVDIDVPDSMQIADVNVNFDVSFNFGATAASNETLILALFAPDGTPAYFCGNGAGIPGGLDCPGTGGFNQPFDDEGAASEQPLRPLSAFDGLNPQGTWQFRVGVVNPSCALSGEIRSISISIEVDRSTEDYIVVRGFTKNNLLLSPWVRLAGGGIDETRIFLSATAYSVGPNGFREAGRGDDVANPAPLTWAWSGAPHPFVELTPDGRVTAMAADTNNDGALDNTAGEASIVASGGGYTITMPLFISPPEWNPDKRRF